MKKLEKVAMGIYQCLNFYNKKEYLMLMKHNEIQRQELKLSIISMEQKLILINNTMLTAQITTMLMIIKDLTIDSIQIRNIKSPQLFLQTQKIRK